MNNDPNASVIARAEKYAGIDAQQAASIPEPSPAEKFDIYVKTDSPEQVTAFTVVVSTINPSQLLLPMDPCRRRATIVAVDGPVVLSQSLELSQSPQNSATAAGLPASGFVLPMGLPGVVVESEGALWVSLAGSTATRVSVISERYEQDA